MDIPHIPGRRAGPSLPFLRFLPPIEAGAVRELVRAQELEQTLLLDPYGSSPQLVVEAARAGCAVLTAVNNPITRFTLRALLQPFELDELRAALAALAASEKDGHRLEEFLLGLYESDCTECGGRVNVDYFVWSSEQEAPLLKAYACPHCNHAGEEQASVFDRERASDMGARGLQRAMALEAIAPAGDPDRAHAEAALGVYPPRALFALITLVNKQEQLTLPQREREALHALLLAAFDAADKMWAHPEGRPRPKQLTPSPEYREMNLWRALERAVDEWARPEAPLPVRTWPEDGQPQPGEVAIFPGAVRELVETLDIQDLGAVLTVPPRPNQAYWTLSALWTSWLWGRAAAEGIRAALRRRRYDWSWHAEALRRTFEHLAKRLPAEMELHVLIPESEAGYLGACLSGWDAAGMALQGRSLRADERQARLLGRMQPAAGQSSTGGVDFVPLVREALVECLRRRAEPTHFVSLQAAAASELARRRLFAEGWAASDEPPLAEFNRSLEEVLADRGSFVRIDQRQDLETGVFWLSSPAEQEERLADRVERSMVAALRRQETWPWLELDRTVCRQLPGLLTPDRALVRAALESYAEQDEQGRWRLRPEDTQRARQLDLAEVSELLREIGMRLEFDVAGQNPIRWRGQDQVYSFSVLETSILSEGPDPDEVQGLVYVIPGGRASLLAEKARRDARLNDRLERGLMVLKFRHVRRLASDTTLTRSNLLDRLALDPPGHQDPQLPLL